MTHKTLAAALTLLVVLPALTTEPPRPAPQDVGQVRTLTFADRVAAQRAIEKVYWGHRIWPDQNPGSKPEFDQGFSVTVLLRRVEDGLRKAAALERLGGRRINAAAMQVELDRMARDTKAPARLAELWAALDHDPVRIAEVLVRPRLADRELRRLYAWSPDIHRAVRDRAESARGNARGILDLKEAADSYKEPFEDWWLRHRGDFPPSIEAAAGLSLPSIVASACSPGTWSPMDPVLPTPRSDHAAVWTGSEMIVWGGQEAVLLADGGRYDPATDSWAAMSLNGAPAARVYATAVWTGSRMIVWGGNAENNEALATGGRYDPVTDTWSATSMTGVPAARAFHAAVWTGGRMLVWGGTDAYSLTDFGDGGRYDPITDVWSPIATAGSPAPRNSLTAVWDGTEMLVWGGQWYDSELGQTVPLATGGRYNPSSDTWQATRVNGAPAARYGHTAVWTGTSMIVWGGWHVDPDAGWVASQSGGVYQPSNNQWSPTSTAAAPSKRSLHSAIWTGSKMLVWGGEDEFGDWLGDGGGYNPSTNTWTSMPAGGDAPDPRKHHTAVWTGTEMIIWGGDAQYAVMDDGGRYNPSANSWSPTSSSDRPASRVLHAMVWTGAEVIVWGGTVGFTIAFGGSRYDPAVDAWMPVTTIGEPTRRYGHPAVWTGTEMIVWGGDTPPQALPPADGGRYDPASDVWTPTNPAEAPAPRSRQTAVWSGTEMLVWGGAGPSAELGMDTGGRYRPASDAWTPMSTDGAPCPRYSHAAAWTGREMLVWSGDGPTCAGNAFATGGSYDPFRDAWQGLSMNGAPPSEGVDLALWTGRDLVVVNSNPPATSETDRYDPGSDAWSATSDPDRALLVATTVNTGVWMCGGLAAKSWTDDAWRRFDPDADSWSPLPSTSSIAPSPVAVSTRTGLIAWGGSGNTAYGSDRGAVYCGCLAEAPPGPVHLANFGEDGGIARLGWAALPEATGYDVVRGDLSVLRATAGNFSAAMGTCLASNQPLTWLSDPEDPGSSGFWYLVRARGPDGPSTYDEGGGNQVGARDPEIAASASACP